MKVLTGPRVTVVGKTQFVVHPVYQIPEDGTDAEKLGAFSAKGCYDSYGAEGRSIVENQKAVIESLHGSVIEHSYASLFIEGVTRALTLELNRHRPFNISQRSTRYTKEEDAAIVLEPYYATIWNKYKLRWENERIVLPAEYDDFDAQTGMALEDILPGELWLVYKFVYQCAASVREYQREVELLVELNPEKLEKFDLRKWARGKARNILPHALETRGTWTANHRAWRWFIEARSSRHAESEIRVLAEQVFHTLQPLAPTYYDDFKLTGIFSGIPEYTPTHHKV